MKTVAERLNNLETKKEQTNAKALKEATKLYLTNFKGVCEYDVIDMVCDKFKLSREAARRISDKAFIAAIKN